MVRRLMQIKVILEVLVDKVPSNESDDWMGDITPDLVASEIAIRMANQDIDMGWLIKDVQPYLMRVGLECDGFCEI